VILTRDSAIEYLGEVTIAPVNSTICDVPSELSLSREEGCPAIARRTSTMFRR
jgi:mRNA interferase MazF